MGDVSGTSSRVSNVHDGVLCVHKLSAWRLGPTLLQGCSMRIWEPISLCHLHIAISEWQWHTEYAWVPQTGMHTA